MRVLWVVMDALGADKVTSELMPNLVALSSTGSVSHGIGVLPTTTYPNHATFVTGVEPAIHGLYANDVLRADRWVGAQTVGPDSPTIFDRCRELGLKSVAVLGDQNLVGVCGAGAATLHWPPGGVLVEGIACGPTGYAADTATVDAALELGVEQFEFAMVHLDENDAVSHIHGPHSEEARAQATASDIALGRLFEAYGPYWDDTVVIVLSDHSQEDVEAGAAVDMSARLEEVIAPVDPSARWRCDGTCLVVAPGMHPDVAEAVRGSVGVSGAVGGQQEGLVAWGSDGVLFGLDWGQGGDHGSIRCRAQVVVVGGGHPDADDLANSAADSVSSASSWYRRTLSLLGAVP